MKTKADRWAFVLEGLVIIVSTDDLKKAIDKYGRPISNKIEPNPSKGFLITINDLIEIQRGNYIPYVYVRAKGWLCCT
jgi:hypothetical protein